MKNKHNPASGLFLTESTRECVTFAAEGARCTVELVKKEYAQQSRIYKYKSEFSDTEFIYI